MSITDELRVCIGDLSDEMRTYTGDFYFRRYKDVREKLYAIADRIDEAHTHAIVCVDAREPEMMAENGWVKLPTDANGELWRVGDMAKSVAFPRNKARKVCGTGVLNGKPAIFYASKGFAGKEAHIAELNTGWDYADSVCHHHETTVEDVLCELLDKVDDDRAGQAEIIAEYAGKFRLANSEE